MATLHLSVICILGMVLMANVYATNLAHSVFMPSKKSINPFGDLFVQQVVFMDQKESSGVPVLSDEEFLQKLMHNDDLLRRPSVRNENSDPYASILDDKIDDQLASQDTIDGEWVHLMTSGPLAINYVSNLLVIASRRDFHLARSHNSSFQHIKYPDSFQATLAQISGAMYSALMGAHTTMDRIQLNVQQVPSHIKTALQLLLSASPKLINILLPSSLESIGRIANESAVYARQTFDKFTLLQDLIAEVIEVSTYTHSTKKYRVEEIQAEINKTKLEEKQFNDNLNLIRSQYESARQEVVKARQEYQTASNAIPTKRFFGWLKKLFKKIVQIVVKIIILPLRILGCILGLCYTDRLAYETAKQNAIAKANLQLQVLQEAEKRFDSFAKQQEIEQQKLTAVIQKLAALDLNKMSEEEIVDVLYECLIQMNQIKAQWGRLIQFFSKLSVQAESTQQIILYELIGIVQDALTHNILLDPVDREFFVGMLSLTCQEIERGAHLLFVMSKTYYDVSSEYMINQISGMNALLLLRTNEERSSYLKVLNSTTTSTSSRIIQLGQERHNEYSLRNKARREEFEAFLAKMAEEELDGSDA